MQNLNAISIGSERLQGRAILAPMSGVTDHIFRKISRRFGASLVVSEMVASDDFVKGSEESRLRAEGGGIDQHVVQIAGCEPHWMGEAARLAEASGAAIIDINMGCPAKRVTGGYAGSALMRDLDHAERLIEATVSAVSFPVEIPVIANGDCHSLKDAQAMLAASQADGVMIGRSALGRPWLIGQIAQGLERGQPIPAPSAQERLEAAIEHYEGLLAAMGVETGLRHARKHIAAYADDALSLSQEENGDLRQAIVTTNSPSKVIELLTRLYQSQPTRSAA